MARITRTEAVNGVDGADWYPARDDAGNITLGKGTTSEEAKVAVVLVATEDEAIEKLKTREYWIRMTFDGNKAPSLIMPASLLIDGQPVATTDV